MRFKEAQISLGYQLYLGDVRPVLKYYNNILTKCDN